MRVTILRDLADVPSNRLADRIGLGVLTQLVTRDMVDEVLATTGSRERRSRLLPARVMVYYVLAMTLFYEDAYEEVMQKLVNGLRALRSWRDDWTMPTTGAISRARSRLGADPLKELFHRVAVPIAEPGTPGAWYRERRVMALDGVVLDVADTPDNGRVYEKSGRGQSASAFPQVRLVGLAECGTHAIVAAAFDSWRTYERALAERLLDDHVEADMLLLADRGFYSYDLWAHALQTGAALLWRVPMNVRLPMLHRHDDGSYASELLPKQLKTDLNRGMKRRVPEGVRIPVRVVEYQVGNRASSDVIRLVTSLTDPIQAPAHELAALYAERWEFEIGLDEIETHQVSNSRVLRSRKADLVEQEIWGLLLAHYAIRHLMHQAADDLDIDEDRLSFMRSLRVVRRSIVNDSEFPP